ncbi:hypothetical protein J437_LFUL010179 [Ladona fulva]|uniref:Prokineticin domain-containing protein n=1 Tax=Ladona fulva TaxID=123851 RepID=A0A8K0K8A8_LADFU|nr:hypothetical protein J437_LFUL010179 [Ladona fulva]
MSQQSSELNSAADTLNRLLTPRVFSEERRKPVFSTRWHLEAPPASLNSEKIIRTEEEMFHQRKSRTQLFGSMSLATLVLMALLVNSAQSFLSERCTSNSECEEGFCCKLSMSRYSIPTCEAMRTEGELCRKASEMTHNLTLGYPNGDKLELKGVHLVMCPCGEGLHCDDGVCVKR